MKKTIALTAAIWLSVIFSAAAQNKVSGKTSFIFSAIKGTVSKPDSIILPVKAKAVKLIAGDVSSFKILSYSKNKLIVAFTPAVDFVGIKKASIQVTNTTGTSTLNLTGLSTNGLEGRNEATLAKVAETLGYQVNVGWTTLDNNILPQIQGDEIAAAVFRKAGKGKVEIIPVARYSPDFELPFGYYINKDEKPDKHEVGVLAKAAAYPEHQCLFPAIASGTNSFDPGNQNFGFYFTSPTHSAWSEDVWNMLFFPANAVHATRIYPLKDAAGKLISNTYLLCYEEAKNGDYNDYVFVVKNIVPANNELFTPLFNGKNLDGWHTFLRGIGTADPNNNFNIKDEMLHVIGKDLGYAITEKPYSNYHFKLDFKWGESKWGSRVNLVRDAGICYNIPLNEPDSIWPRSIECQIQEGDVGDFWLLGFSTIKVKGVQNKPANHTRMVKYADAEKPSGQWNTVEVISYNGKCVHIVNGVVVNVGEDASIKSGRILLQSEFAEIYYRNVKIRKL